MNLYQKFDENEVPFNCLVTGDESEMFAFSRYVTIEGKATITRIIRGEKCKVVSGLFDEVSSAFQFPYYFGENWAAFDECIFRNIRTAIPEASGQ